METAKKEIEVTPKGKKVKIPKDKNTKGPDKAPVKLISYSMKMVIPTGNYANIQPEIVVKAGTIEQAHDFIAPHMNKLWKEYYMISEKRPEPAKPSYDATVVGGSCRPDTPSDFKPNQMPPASSVAFTKASQAITSCLSHKALEIIKNQIEVSVKLTPEDKEKLQPLIVARIASGQLTE